MGLRVGDIVDYHSVIGGEITSRNHVINVIAKLKGGQIVAWISGKPGCVALSALSKVPKGKLTPKILKDKYGITPQEANMI